MTASRFSGCLTRLASALIIAIAPLTGALAQNGKAARFYEDALKRFEAKDVTGAEVQLKNALREDGRWLPALMLMGQVSLANSNPGAAEGAYLAALDHGASRSEVVLPLGQAFMLQGKHLLMLQDPRMQPGTDLPVQVRARAHLLQAAAHIDLGNDRAASLSIAAAKGLQANLPDVWLTEVRQKIRSQQLEAAETALARAVQLAPQSVEVLYEQAALSHVSNRLDAALASYSAVLAQKPDHLEALIARAGIALDQGRLAAAQTDIDAARKLQEQEPRAAYLGSLLAEARGDRAASQAALREVANLIDSAPPEMIRFRPQILMLGGLAHVGLGNAEKARPYLELLVKQQPRSPANKLLVQVLVMQGQTENAIVLLESYLKNQPNDLQALAMLASAHSSVGRHAKATQIMSQALSARDNPQLRTVLGHALMRSGKRDEALRELESVWKRSPGNTSAGFGLAMLHLANRQGAKALAIAKPLAAANPNQASLQHLLGLAQMASGDAKGARASFENATKLNRNLLEPQLSLARLDAQAGQNQAAAQRLETLIQANPKQLEPMLERASLAVRQGQQDVAKRWLERAISDAAPRDPRAHLAMITLHLSQGRTAEAAGVAKTLFEAQPDDPTVLLVYGRTLVASGKLQEAKQPLINASRRMGDDAIALTEVARLQVAAQDANSANYTLSKVLELQPGLPEAIGLQISVDLMLKDIEAASKRLRQLMTLRPREARTHLLAADIAAARKQPGDVLAAVRKAHEVEPSSDTAQKLMLAARLKDSSGRETQAVGEAWLRQKPGDLNVLDALAELHSSRKEWSAAKARYEQALRLTPNHPRRLNNLANVLLRLNDAPGAQRHAEAALKAAPGQPFVMDTLAWALHRQGQNERALGLLRDARLRAPEHAEIRYHLAVVLAALGRHKEAKPELDASLAQPTGLESVTEAQELARTLK